MRKILTIISLLLLALSLDAQTARQLKVYQRGGAVDTLRLSPGTTISHSKTDAAGRVYDDYVTLEVRNLTPPAEGQDPSSSQPSADGGQESVRHYLIADLDSLVFPDGRTVVFRGATTGKPDLAPVPQGGADGPLHSSFSGTFPGSGSMVTFYWTENDHLRLETGQESRATSLSRDKTNAEFVFEDIDPDVPFYSLYYPDKTVTIATEQNQNGVDNSDHIGTSGDCGTARAERNGDAGTYDFTLRHQAAYLCFLPRIDYLPSAKVTKIVVTCSNPIAGTFRLSDAGMYDGENTSQTITLNLAPHPQRLDKDFFLSHETATAQAATAAYMVIAPPESSSTFTITYHLVDTLSRHTTTYTQTINSFQPVANTVYPVTCNIPESLFRTVDLGYDYEWSSVNLGSNQPDASGSVYTWDASHEAMADSWQMPSEDAANELMEKCTWTWGTYNGTDGWMVEGTNNGNDDIGVPRIFLPASGYLDGGTVRQNTDAYYWLDTGDSEAAEQSALVANGDGQDIVPVSRLLAMNTRAVKSVPRSFNIPSSGTQYVDLRGHGPGYTIKVYDHGGPNSNYGNSVGGYLQITCAEGYKLNVTGSVDTESPDKIELLTVTSSGNKQNGVASGYNSSINATSTGNVVLLYFHSDGSVVASGLDLTVTIQKSSLEYAVNIADVEGGTMVSNVAYANPEDTITLTAMPAPGYAFSHVEVKTADKVLTLYEDDPRLFKVASSAARHYVMSDTTRVRDNNWWHDEPFFLMPYGDVTVTPVFVKDAGVWTFNMAGNGTQVIESRFVQQLIDADVNEFAFYDYLGPDNTSYDDNVNGYMKIHGVTGYRLYFTVQPWTEASCDYLRISDSNFGNSVSISQVSGNTTANRITSVIPYSYDFDLYFHTDGSNHGYRGFMATVAIERDTVTRFNMRHQSTITFPEEHIRQLLGLGKNSITVYDSGGPNGYYGNSPNDWCYINLPEGYHAHITGTIHLETNYEYLHILDDGVEKLSKTGEGTFVDYTTTGRVIAFRLTGDSGGTRAGYALTVEFIKDEE